MPDLVLAIAPRRYSSARRPAHGSTSLRRVWRISVRPATVSASRWDLRSRSLPATARLRGRQIVLPQVASASNLASASENM